jgi:transposase InsO family protein
VDLIDLHLAPDGQFRFILNIQDHLTKFCCLHALPNKQANTVLGQVVRHFCTFGAPSILQSDNGKEFTARIISDLQDIWPQLALVHGRPRYPQSQGSVERSNGDVKIMVGHWMRDHDSVKWSVGLPWVQLQKNTALNTGTKFTKFEHFFEFLKLFLTLIPKKPKICNLGLV